jgi:hypothetical protein
VANVKNALKLDNLTVDVETDASALPLRKGNFVFLVLNYFLFREYGRTAAARGCLY